MKKYLFKSSRQSEKGILSSVLGGTSLLSFTASLCVVLRAGEFSGGRLGAVGFISCLFSMAGLILGLLGLYDREALRLFPRLGFALSLCSLLAWSSIVYIGL